MKRYSISRRLFVQIVVTILVAGAVTTAIDFGNQLQIARELRDRDADLIENNILPVLSYLVWILNEEQAEELAWSLAERPEIARVSITREDGSMFLSLHSHEHLDGHAHYQRTWPITHFRGGESVALGTLQVEFTSLLESVVTNRIFVWSLVPDLLLLLMVVLIVALFLRKRISEPLMRLKHDIDRIDLTERMPSWWASRERHDPTYETRKVREVIGQAGDRVLNEIRERREREANLAASLEEKNILLKEIHHRVKNNLQMVVSLLSLQRRGISNPEAQEALLDSENRVTSMSLVHELLYRADRYSDIDLSNYMRDLAGTIVYQTGNGRCKISMEYRIESIFVDLGVAIPLGLIVNELLTNAMKHAFTDRDTGTIAISTTRDPATGRTTLSICDDGRGLPENWLEVRKGSLGLQIVEALCAQIGADLKVESRPGTTCLSITLTLHETPTLEQFHE
jgi:two-component sensor histidine kinase